MNQGPQNERHKRILCAVLFFYPQILMTPRESERQVMEKSETASQ